MRKRVNMYHLEIMKGLRLSRRNAYASNRMAGAAEYHATAISYDVGTT
ncbi:MAG TPA: hypothetical protein VF452_10165 [Candidatus Binatia bacterium]